MDKIKIYTNWLKKFFLIIIIVEIISFWGHEIDLINKFSFCIILGITFYLSLKKLSWGFWIASTELIIGSFGQLFNFEVFGFLISIRLGIFIVLMLALIIKLLKTKELIFYRSEYYKYYVLFFVFLIVGVLIGLNNGNLLKDVFYDFNGFLYFLLIFVAFEVIRNWESINKFIQLIFASVLAMTIKTLFLVYFFSHVHDTSLITLVYKWIRDTRIGEIAQIMDNYYRIFFQSHVWAVIAFIIILVYLIYTRKNEIPKKDYIWAWIILSLSLLNIIISFSRSFWLALLITILIIVLFLYFKEKFSFFKLIKLSFLFLLIILFNLLFITLIVNVNFVSDESNNNSVSVATLIKTRVTDTNEAAVTSRYELISPLFKKISQNPIIGSGFGTTVTYNTDDPRSKGLYTTYTFEWGYLDLLIKIGLLGLIIYLLFIFKIFKNGLSALKKSVSFDAYKIILGFLFSIIFILLTHFTTPYLNHPLGIFLIITSLSIFDVIIKGNSIKITTLEK